MGPKVDHDLCIGCGNCEDVCPEVFVVREDGLSYVINETPDPELYGCMSEAAESCPVNAISIHE